MNKRPVTVFCKLAIFWPTMGFGVNFIVRTRKCRYDDQHETLPENDDSEAIDSML